MKNWSKEELTNSIPYKTNFLKDSYELFRNLDKELVTKDNNGIFHIWKSRNKIGKEDGRSLFNKLNTNYTAYNFLVNKTLEKMKDESCNPTTENGYHKIIDFLMINKDFFKSLLPSIGNIIENTTAKGDLVEKKSEDIINKFWPGCKIESGGFGKFSDMMLGTDKKIKTIDGQVFTIQVKLVSILYQKGENIIVHYLSAKPYKYVDYFIFNLSGTNKFLLFSNKNTKVEPGKYIFPIKDCIKILN